MKKFLVGVLVVLLVLTQSMLPVLPSVLAAAPTDIAGNWAEADIMKLVNLSYSAGYPDGTFKADNSVTRAEFLKIMTSVLNYPEPAPAGASPYSDVAMTDWFFQYVISAGQNNLVGGYPDSSFLPNNPITRQEVAKILVKAKNIDETTYISADELANMAVTVPDWGTISEWARPFVASAIKAGLMKGDPSGNFRPLGNLTRAETATVGARLLPAEGVIKPGLSGMVIAFLTFDPANRQSEINLINADGSNQSPLPNTSGAAAVSWSPDGKMLAFIVHHNDNDWSIYVVNADGSNRTRLTQGQLDHFPSWSPDGSKMVFSRNGNIWVMSFSAEPTPQVSDLKQLTTDPREYASVPVWSPDGKQIVFASQVGDAKGTADYNDPNSAEIYLINADGSNLRKLTDNQAMDGGPAWSPDGKEIAFSSNQDGAFQIYRMNTDGANLRQLTKGSANNTGPAWSPDGEWIAYSSDRDGPQYTYEIYLMAVDGSNQTRLTHSPLDDFGPVWRPATTVSPSSTDLVFEVPHGSPPTLDGVLSPGEWEGALHQESTNNGELLLMQDDSYLYLGIHENFVGLTVTSVFFEHGDEISVLHSSGSLGTAIFQRNMNGWLLTQPFAWALYEVIANTSSNEQLRTAFLKSNGWLANLGSMTNVAEIEYKIAIPDGPFRIAVAYLLQPDFGKAAWWPSGLSDDCRNISLLQANIAESLHEPLLLQFAPETWAAITIP